MGSILREKPPMINSNFCEVYADAEKGTCSENCPFYLECTPYFEEIARVLETGKE